MRFISNIYISLIGDSHGPRAQASCSQCTCNRKDKLNLFSSSNGSATGSLSEAHLQRAFSDLAKKTRGDYCACSTANLRVLQDFVNIHP